MTFRHCKTGIFAALAAALMFTATLRAAAHERKAVPLPSTSEASVQAGYTVPQQQVADSERAFAATMKNRDHAAMAKFVADDAICFTGTGVLRGRAEILTAWRKYYEAKQAPFSWGPDQVEIFPAGKLAYSGGTVRDPAGKPIARFNSIWRQDDAGRWTIIFDRGEPLPGKTTP